MLPSMIKSVHQWFSTSTKEERQSIFNKKSTDITLNRRLARFLSNYEWYNPSRNLAGPNLDEAWEFYERHMLPRHFVDEGRQRKYRRAESGENEYPTELYSVWDTSLEDMGEFGVGVGLYFNTLKFFAIMCFIAGCINLPNLIYFSSNNYSPDPSGIKNSMSFSLRTSAICTNTSWEPCPTCSRQDFYFAKKSAAVEQLAFAHVNGKELPFILKNNCQVNGLVTGVMMLTVGFILVSLYYFVRVQWMKWREIDYSMQTSSDYSIEVTNPPLDARDPEQWKSFFEEKFDNVHVTVCTVVVDNEDLIAKMVKRRKYYDKFRLSLPQKCKLGNTTNSLDEAVPFAPVRSHGLVQKIKALDDEIGILAKQSYAVSSVFITFEKQEQQQRVLKQMKMAAARPEYFGDNFKFDGRIITVIEPGEPSSIRWADLDEGTLTRLFQRILTFSLSLLIIYGGSWLIILGKKRNFTMSSIVIILLNAVTPHLVRYISKLESHSNQGSYAGSVYLKITAIRWVFTGYVISASTPFTDVIREGGLLRNIQNLFIAEILQRPILQLLDIIPNIKRHYLAPRAPDQERMNLCFLNSSYQIGERYTNVSKVLFLTFIYCTLMPASFFFASVIFMVYYWMDKYCILRVWKQAPRIDAEISIVSIYVFFLNMVIYAISAVFSIGQFSYDNACALQGSYVPDDYMNVTNIVTDKGNSFEMSIDENSMLYHYCDQNLLRSSFIAFPFSSLLHQSEWMSPMQARLGEMAGWFGIFIYITVATSILYHTVKKKILPMFMVVDSTENNVDSTLGFCEVNEIYGYVPQVQIPRSLYPKLVCDINSDCKDLVGWTDPKQEEFDIHNLIYEVGERHEHAFSVVQKWAP